MDCSNLIAVMQPLVFLRPQILPQMSRLTQSIKKLALYAPSQDLGSSAASEQPLGQRPSTTPYESVDSILIGPSPSYEGDIRHRSSSGPHLMANEPTLRASQELVAVRCRRVGRCGVLNIPAVLRDPTYQAISLMVGRLHSLLQTCHFLRADSAADTPSECLMLKV